MCNSKNLALAYKFEVRGLREATLYKELVLKVIKQSDWLWTKKKLYFQNSLLANSSMLVPSA